MVRLLLCGLLSASFVTAQTRVQQARAARHEDRLALHHVGKRRREEQQPTQSGVGGSTTRALVTAGGEQANASAPSGHPLRIDLAPQRTAFEPAAVLASTPPPGRAPPIRRI